MGFVIKNCCVEKVRIRGRICDLDSHAWPWFGGPAGRDPSPAEFRHQTGGQDTQPKRNFAMPGYDTQFPDGGGPLEKTVKRVVIAITAIILLFDRDQVMHEWHKYKTGNEFSNIDGWFTPLGVGQGPKREGLKTRYA